MKRYKDTPYFITTCGKVWSERTNKFIATCISKNGYSMVDFNINGKRTHHYVHILVAECYIPNLENKPQVNHKNGDKSKNYVGNLEWCTQSENNIHAYNNGLSKIQKEHLKEISKVASSIKKKKVAKISDDGSEVIYNSLKDASEKTGICRTSIGRACNGKQIHAGGYKWKFIHE